MDFEWEVDILKCIVMNWYNILFDFRLCSWYNMWDNDNQMNHMECMCLMDIILHIGMVAENWYNRFENMDIKLDDSKCYLR